MNTTQRTIKRSKLLLLSLVCSMASVAPLPGASAHAAAMTALISAIRGAVGKGAATVTQAVGKGSATLKSTVGKGMEGAKVARGKIAAKAPSSAAVMNGTAVVGAGASVGMLGAALAGGGEHSGAPTIARSGGAGAGEEKGAKDAPAAAKGISPEAKEKNGENAPSNGQEETTSEGAAADTAGAKGAEGTPAVEGDLAGKTAIQGDSGPAAAGGGSEAGSAESRSSKGKNYKRAKKHGEKALKLEPSATTSAAATAAAG